MRRCISARPPANQSYIIIDKIMSDQGDGRASGLHPRYGFLSENPKFAQASRPLALPLLERVGAIEAIGATGFTSRNLQQRQGVFHGAVLYGPAFEDAEDSVLKISNQVGLSVHDKAMLAGGG